MVLMLTLLISMLFQSPYALADVTTEAPTTEAPTTEVATTQAATTEAPTTEKATTELPTTEQATTETPAGPNSVKILHTNDMHGRLDAEDGRVIGMAKVGLTII